MFGRKKKIDKAAWAEAIYQKKIAHPEKEPEEKLVQLTTFMVEQHHRIIRESLQIVLTTKYAETRQGRVDLCHKHYTLLWVAADDVTEANDYYQDVLKGLTWVEADRLVWAVTDENGAPVEL